jgi:hypothetical protein
VNGKRRRIVAAAKIQLSAVRTVNNKHGITVLTKTRLIMTPETSIAFATHVTTDGTRKMILIMRGEAYMIRTPPSPVAKTT